ncbi:MAG: hypothetical protein ACE5J3_13025 [Methanosarcinales archaeon]
MQKKKEYVIPFARVKILFFLLEASNTLKMASKFYIIPEYLANSNTLKMARLEVILFQNTWQNSNTLNRASLDLLLFQNTWQNSNTLNKARLQVILFQNTCQIPIL